MREPTSESSVGTLQARELHTVHIRGGGQAPQVLPALLPHKQAVLPVTLLHHGSGRLDDTCRTRWQVTRGMFHSLQFDDDRDQEASSGARCCSCRLSITISHPRGNPGEISASL